MKNLERCVCGVLLLFALAGCSKFEYHPYDGRINGSTNLNKKNITKIEKQCADRDTVCFAVISDTQRRYDDTRKLVRDINSRKEVDFTINLGDLTDFGETKEFVWMRDVLGKLDKPCVCLIGNHDCLGTGEKVYKAVYGEENFAFTAGFVRFVCINTNSREYDHTTAVPDFGFIKNETDSFPKEAECTVVAMHAPPGSEQFDNNISWLFENEIKKFPNLLFCLHGHTHHTAASDIFGDGTVYYGCANAMKRTYLVFKIYRGGYSRDVVEL